ncbi:MAG: hypothetical protein HN732_08120 [Rhodospirillaceae bacterium]|nr:hypothetical protein [Rhodospirillaceae bacterium]MBT7757276.1 hypothetical protein [Rhodospirillaceae bacterium]
MSDQTPDAVGQPNTDEPQQEPASPPKKQPYKRPALLLLAVFIIALFGSVGGGVITILFADDLASVIRGHGYRPTKPPDTSSLLGDVHVVDFFGNVKGLKCSVSGEPPSRRSKGGRTVVSSVGSSSSDGGDGFKGFKSENVTRLDILLDNIKYIKTDAASIRGLLHAELTSNSECQELIAKLVNEGTCVSQITSIMIADGQYKKVLSGGGEIAIEMDNLGEIGVANNLAAKMGFGTNVFVVGEGLHYGVQMDDRCLAAGDALLTRFVPSETWWAFTPLRNLYHSAVLKILED